MNKLFPLTLLSFLALTMLSGCLSLERDYPDKRHYLLEVSRPGEPVSTSLGESLPVQQLNSSDAFDRRGFVYRRSGHKFVADYYNEFLVPPKSQVSELVRQWFKQAEYFGAVTNLSSRLETTYLLEGTIVTIHGDYRGQTPQAVLEMEFLLLERTKQAGPVFQRRYREEVPLADEEPGTLVDGWNEALREILSELETDVIKSTS